MNLWKTITALFSIVALFPLPSSSQESHYIETGFTGCVSTFRDMATSPLYYTGQMAGYTGGWHAIKEGRERSVQLTYLSGSHTSNFNNTSNISSFTGIDLLIRHLYSVGSYHNISAGIGGTILSTTNMRSNKSLMNNSFGLENISNLMLSGKLSADISRNKPGVINLGIFNIRLNPAKRFISFTLNAGILNFNYRPGYAYNYLPEVNGVKMNNFKDFKLSLNGYRINTLLSFSRELKNKNIIKASYQYDLYKAPGRYEPFSHGRHSVRLALMFNYK
jgi:hypothetical protein